MQFLRPVAVSVVLVWLSAGVSQAALITANHSISLAGYTGANTFGIPTLTIAAGDTVDSTVNFLNNKALLINDGGESFRPWFYAGDNNSSFVISNITIELLGFLGTGGATSTYNIALQSSGQAHLGPELTNFLTAGQSVTFSGYHVTYDVDSIAVSPHDYSSIWLVTFGNWSVVDAPNVVPEPTSFALLGMGGLSLCGYQWRRKRQIA